MAVDTRRGTRKRVPQAPANVTVSMKRNNIALGRPTEQQMEAQ